MLNLVAGVAVLLLLVALLLLVMLEVRGTRARKKNAPSLLASFALAMANILPYRRLVGSRRDVMRMADGGYMAIFELSAGDRESFSDGELNSISDSIGNAVGAINERFIVHLRKSNEVVRDYARPASYTSSELEWLDGERERTYTAGRTYTSRVTVAIRWVPEGGVTDSGWRAFTRAVEGLVGKSTSHEDGGIGEPDTLAQFEADLEPAVNLLRSYAHVRRLGVRRDMVGGTMVDMSEVFEEISYAIGGRRRKRKVPRTLLSAASLLAEPWRGGSEPRIGDLELAVVVLKDLPGATEPTMLHDLGQLRTNFDFVVRWMPISVGHSRALAGKAHAEWRMKATSTPGMTDVHALAMQSEAEMALGMTTEGVRFGVLSGFVLLRGTSRAAVDAAAGRAVGILDELGVPSFVASMTTEDDWFATLPGNGHGGVRRMQVHCMNLADLFSLHIPSRGKSSWPASFMPGGTPPLSMASAGKASMSYGLIPAASYPPDLSHMLGVGGAGSGKSTTIGHLGVSWLGRVPSSGWTAIDTGRSLYRPARFFDAPFYDLLGRNSPGIALFSDLDDAQSVVEIGGILRNAISLRGVAMTAKREEAIDGAIAHLSTLPLALRSMSALLELLQDPEDVLRPALRRLCRSGPLGNLLDTEVDTFGVARFSVIDLGRVWNMEPSFLIPVLQSVFWKARRSVQRLKEREGNYIQPWLYTLDEAHRPLEHPLGSKWVKEVLKLGRRELLSLAMFSNAAQEFAEADILNDIKEQVASRFFARSSAVRGDDVETLKVRGYYSALGLPPHGIATLPDVTPRSWLFNQPHDRELQEISWDLSPAELAVYGRTNSIDNDRVDEFIAAYPMTWREELLRYEGVPEESIRRFLAIRDRRSQTQMPSLIAAG